MVDLVMQGLLLVAVALAALTSTRVGSGWSVPPNLLALLLLSCYVSLVAYLAWSRIAADARLWLLAALGIVFLVVVHLLSLRRGRAIVAFTLAGSCVMSIGVVWGLRMLASGSLSWTRTGSTMSVAAALIVIALLVPRSRVVLERSPSWLLGFAGLVLIGLPLLTWGRVNSAFIQVRVPLLGSVQPGELGRILLILWLARSIAYRRPRLALGGWQGARGLLGLLWTITAPIALGVMIGLFSNDLGPALVLTLTAAVMVFVGGLGWGLLATVLALGAAGVALITRLSDKVGERFAILADPLSTTTGGGLEQVGMGLAAMAHGATGLGLGVPNQIAQWNTDMVLAAIGHELGLSHIVVILVATATSAVASWQMIVRIPDDRRQLTIVGLGAVLSIQTLLMVSAMFALTPLTGMPVPLVSLSGSSLLSAAFAFALILATGSEAVPSTVKTPLTSRARVWAWLVVLICLLLSVKALVLEVGSARLIESIRGRDPIGNRLANSHAARLTTQSGTLIAGPVSTDGMPLRPANTERDYPLEEYATLLGSPAAPGLDHLVGTEIDCSGVGCPPIRTTLVDSVQDAAWEGLQGRTGSVVAVDVETGDILAYVSTEEGVSSGREDRVRSKTAAPGSVAKIVTGAAAVTEGVQLDLPRMTQYRSIRSYNDLPCGGTLTEAIAESCNPYFGQLGDEVGAERLSELSVAWLNNQEDLSGLPIATSALVDTGAPEELVAMGAIGLGNAQVTPLGVLSATVQIARNGDPVCLRVLADVEAGCEEQHTMSIDAATAVSAGMRETVLSGTARAVPGLQELQAAAKTGTADFDGSLNNATFTAFAPFDDPQVAVVVFVEPGPAGTTNLTGSVDAGPIAVSVVNAALNR